LAVIVAIPTNIVTIGCYMKELQLGKEAITGKSEQNYRPTLVIVKITGNSIEGAI